MLTEDDVVRPRSGFATAVYRAAWYLCRGLMGAYWRLEVIGSERIPRSGAFVVAPVHRSNLDFLLAAVAVRRPVRFMAKSSIFKGGLIDRFLLGMGAFPVVRDTADVRSIARCEAMLSAGEPVVVFPEGRRKEGDEIREMYDGPAFVAARCRVPVIPVGIGGSDRAMPIGSKMIFPRKVVIIIGEPIYPDVEIDGRVPRSEVRRLTERLRSALQPLYDEARSASR